MFQHTPKLEKVYVYNSKVTGEKFPGKFENTSNFLDNFPQFSQIRRQVGAEAETAELQHLHVNR